MSRKQYVVLEGLKEGNRFYTTAGAEETEDSIIRLNDGTVTYKILGFADTDEEARSIIVQGDPRSNFEVIRDYLKSKNDEFGLPNDGIDEICRSFIKD
jgi:hypothetical protein